MARFENGWVAISRRVFLRDRQANPFYGDGELVLIWILLISWANVRDTKTRRGRGDETIPRGSLITSQGEVGDQLGISRQTVRTSLAYLVESQKINLVSNRRGLFITILNYEKYQNANPVDNQDTNQGVTNAQPRGNQGVTNAQPPIEQSNKATKQQSNKEITGTGPATGQPTDQPKSRATWDAYRSAYVLTHGAEPLANVQARSMACKLVDLVGVVDAPEVAEWYVLNERSAWVLKNRHPFGELVKQWQKYHTDWKTKTKVTAATAKIAERDDGILDSVGRFMARKHGVTQTAGG